MKGLCYHPPTVLCLQKKEVICFILTPDSKPKLFSFQTSEGNTHPPCTLYSVYLPVTIYLHTQRNKHAKVWSLKDLLKWITETYLCALHNKHIHISTHVHTYTELSGILMCMHIYWIRQHSYKNVPSYQRLRTPCPAVVDQPKTNSIVFLFHFALFWLFYLTVLLLICFDFHFCVFVGFLEVFWVWIFFKREKENITVGEVGK